MVARGRVLCLQHAAMEGPGRLDSVLRRHGLDVEVRMASDPSAIPISLDGFSALVLLGGPMAVYEADLHPFLIQELALLERARRIHLPILGICLGSQLLARSLGAPVYKGEVAEVGLAPVWTSKDALADPVLGGLPSRFTPLHWHGDIFDLPVGTLGLASSQHAPIQAFRAGAVAWGILFHLEIETATARAMADEDAAWLLQKGIRPEDLIADIERSSAEHVRLAEVLFGAFARVVHDTVR